MRMVTTQRGRMQIRYIGLVLPDLPETMTEAVGAALADAIKYWHFAYGPEHFRISAYAKYGGREPHVYTPRHQGRGASKRVRAPLRSPRPHRGFDGERVVPGTLQREFLGGGMKIKPANKRIGKQSALVVTATWPSLPRYTYIDKHGSGRVQGPKKYLELTITSDAEARDMQERLPALIDEHLKKAEQGQTIQAA